MLDTIFYAYIKKKILCKHADSSIFGHKIAKKEMVCRKEIIIHVISSFLQLNLSQPDKALSWLGRERRLVSVAG